MVLFDTSVLSLAFDGAAKPPKDPSGSPIVKLRERIDYLLQGLSESKARILIPTPVLSEYLVFAGKDSSKRLAEISSGRAFRVVPFDTRAAVECADIEKYKPYEEIGSETKSKVKFDRQIIAISKVHSVCRIYTGDNGLARKANSLGIETVMTWNIPLPPEPPQVELDFSDYNPYENPAWGAH